MIVQMIMALWCMCCDVCYEAHRTSKQRCCSACSSAVHCQHAGQMQQHCSSSTQHILCRHSSAGSRLTQRRRTSAGPYVRAPTWRRWTAGSSRQPAGRAQRVAQQWQQQQPATSTAAMGQQHEACSRGTEISMPECPAPMCRLACMQDGQHTLHDDTQHRVHGLPVEFILAAAVQCQQPPWCGVSAVAAFQWLPQRRWGVLY
jgi:hypothetical protein